MYVAFPALMAVVTAAPAATAALVPVAPVEVALVATVLLAAAAQLCLKLRQRRSSSTSWSQHLRRSTSYQLLRQSYHLRQVWSASHSHARVAAPALAVKFISPALAIVRRTCVAGEVRRTCSFKRVNRTGACRVGVAIAPVPAVSYVALLQLCARRRRYGRSALRQSQPDRDVNICG